MRRISRLRKPSGLSCAVPRCSIAPLSIAHQCASSIGRTAPTPSPAALRSYSQQAPSSIPASLRENSAGSEEQLNLVESEVLDEVDPEEVEALHSPFRIPPPRQSSARPDDISDPSYVPALTSEGLAHVGGLEGWWTRREHWPKSSDFRGFKAKKKIQHPAVLEAALRRAVIEATVLKSSGKDQELVDRWPVGPAAAMDRALALGLQVDADGVATLSGDAASVAKDLDWASLDTQEAVAEEPVAEAPVPMPSPAEALSLVETWDESWRAVRLDDPRFKFAVTKRVFQLTGHRIPDYKLADCTMVSGLLASLVAPPKAKTLLDGIIKTQGGLAGLPNVSLSPKRFTRGDKAKTTGQYKLIERELEKRGLQGGPLSVYPSREKQWLKGEA